MDSDGTSDQSGVSDETNVSDGSDVSDNVINSDVKIEIHDDQQQEIDSKKETKKEAISMDTMEKPINESDLSDKQMDEIATGNSDVLSLTFACFVYTCMC